MTPTVIAAPPPVAAAPVSGFIEETYASGLPLVTDLEWGANGVLYVAQKGGVVRVVDNGVITGTFVDLSGQVNDAGERGLLGIAVHPDLLAGSPYVYLLFAHDPPETAGQAGDAGPDGGGQRVSRLVRVTADAATGYATAVAGSETVVLGAGGTWASLGDPVAAAGPNDPWACGDPPSVADCLPADAVTHGAGSVAFGPDGMLYVGNGDAADFAAEARSLRALDLESLAGKVLRIHPDTGLGLPDNPHWTGDGNDNRSRVFTSGDRNPYRFTFGPAGDLWIGDVGSGEWEEVNHGIAGSDFGWPCYEGGANGVLELNVDFASTPECAGYYAANNAVAPSYAYSHAAGSAAIIVGEFVDSPAWPAAYQGRLIVADYVRSTIDAVDVDAPSPTPLALATDSLGVDLTFGPDGHLYYADISNSVVRRIRYTPDEQPPGMLRATSAPPAPTTISANGLARSQWGLDWLMLEPGGYEVCFSDVPGMTTPPCRSAGVAANATTATQGDFAAKGTLAVSAVEEGSGAFVPSVITIDGVAVGEGGVSTQRDAGDYEICWGPVVGWLPPDCQTVPVASDATSSVNGTFEASPGAPGPSVPAGRLRVVSSPAVPTTIFLDGEPVTQWSTEWVPTAIGTYEICYSDVPGYVTPPCETAEVVEGATTAVSGLFEPMGTLRVTTSPPTNVVVTVDGIPRNNWGLFTHIASGSYQVCAEFVAGQVCAQADVTAQTETAVELAPGGAVNEPPVAVAGGDQLVVDVDDSGAELVMLDGSASSDGDGAIVDYTWRAGGVVVASGVSPSISFEVGVHSVELTVTDDDGAQHSDVVEITVDPPPVPPDVLYVSAGDAGVVSGVSFADEDVLRYDWPSATWTMFFDGSDVGVTEDLNGLTLLDDGSMLMTFATRAQIPGLGRVEPHDIVRFVPISTGSSTSGSFETYFEGADVDLRDNAESIDAVGVLANGDLVLSTTGSPEVPGVNGAADEDLLRFDPSELGGGTDGSWSLWLDGSDVGLTQASEDVDAVHVSPTGEVLLSTVGAYAVAGISGASGDIFVCGDPATGTVSACSFAEYWQATDHGFTEAVDAVSITFG